jgi:DNA polymerase-3 subunit epsilon
VKFFSLDIKTANSDPSSICEIGIGTFEDGLLIDSFRMYIDPECTFDPLYTEKVHGITEEMVRGFLDFENGNYEIQELLANNIVVHHSEFIKMGFQKALEKYNIKPYKVFWLDSEIVARRIWDELSEERVGLFDVASFLGIKIAYPDALNCSIAVGKIVFEACKKSGIGIIELFNQVSNERLK